LSRFEAASLSADFEDGDGAGVVDPDGRRGDGAEGFGHAAPVFAGEMAGTEFVGVYLRDGGDQALEEGLLDIFEAEDRRRAGRSGWRCFGEVEGQRGFALRRARGEDEQLGGLKAGGELVELDEPVAMPVMLLPSRKIFSRRSKLSRTMSFDREEADADAVFGELEDGGFGVVEDGVGAVFRPRRRAAGYCGWRG